jgi:hypothetical protein
MSAESFQPLDLSGCAVVSAAAQERDSQLPERDFGNLPTPTPETDAETYGTHWVTVEFARRLELERDAARRDVAEMNARLIEEVASYLRTMEELREENRRVLSERNDARNQLTRICQEAFDMQDTIGQETCADYVLRLLKKEREEASAALDQIRANTIHTCGPYCQRPACLLRKDNAAMREAIRTAYEALDSLQDHVCSGMDTGTTHAVEMARTNAALAKLQPFVSAGGAADE